MLLNPQRLSIIVPTLNEAQGITAMLQRLQSARERGHEIIVVDGGSDDDTIQRAHGLVDQFLHARRGRASQMRAGAAAASGDVLWFVHADCLVPEDADRLILDELMHGDWQWGRFDVRLSGSRSSLRMVERLMNLRSRITGIATGDQAVFVHRALYEKVDGFPDIPLMEDIALSRRLKWHMRPRCLRACVVTSSRRWERNGVWRTIMLMWRLRLAYSLGADPRRLSQYYYGG